MSAALEFDPWDAAETAGRAVRGLAALVDDRPVPRPTHPDDTLPTRTRLQNLGEARREDLRLLRQLEQERAAPAPARWGWDDTGPTGAWLASGGAL